MPKAECRLFYVLLLLVLALAGSGCVSARDYFGDRWADAKDIFTASVGTGYGGVKARVGPIQVGAFHNSDKAGLRGGAFSFDKCKELVLTLPIPLPGIGAAVWFAASEQFSGCDRAAEERGKNYSAGSVFPFVTISRRPYYYSQFEVAAGAGGTLRLGFNPGELLDFLFGWTTLDIFGDDLEARKEHEGGGRKPLEPSTPAPEQPGATP